MARSRPVRREREFVAPDISPDAAIEDLVRDGMLLASTGVRMAAKNLLIIRALRDHEDFDLDYYVSAVQHEFRGLAAEKSADAERVTTARARAAKRKGSATSQADYRAADLPMLDRRIAVLIALADSLIAASNDDAASAELVMRARAAALEDIANAVAPEISEEESARAAREYAVGLDDRRAELAAELTADLERFSSR